MATTLESYLCGKWQGGQGKKAALYNPSTEEVVAETSTEGLDFKAAVEFARTKGGPALRALTFAQRAELLKKLAKPIADNREALIELGIINAGNTRSDAKFDVDGASGTLLYYADLGSKLGDTRVLLDGEGIPLGRSARLYGQHVLVPREGVAVHVNAFNFPAWGMAEKLAVSILAGVPVISKPATATALMAHRIAQLWVESGALPEGAFSFVCGSPGDLLSHLRGQDILAFTGSGDTAAGLRRQEAMARENVHVNVEADSLNAAILGPDVEAGSETMNLFLAEVTKEITQKTGQKCTAVRRIYVPAGKLDEVRDVLVERLSDVKVGNPSDEKVTMGPLATAGQLRDIRAGIEKLAQGAEIACGGTKPVEGLGAPAGKGFFVSPTLLVNRSPNVDDAVNKFEVFGPVATLMPYQDVAGLAALVAAGGGGLVSSVYSDDKGFVQQAVLAIAPHHGRITLGNEKVAGQSVPPGTVMPQLLHGGPGRAGGGEELGGMRGMSLYLQRTALQGHRALIEQLFGAPKKEPAQAQ
ncbi:MAG TPA: 3,4-dehydroadipyl-CoA semialdehyde dehydrogenase [Myxococcaceae bacterium]|nr:3,4-dehydroadipyl-CoA semialdehyde dehydrogenase [Myxococcaceae bacterium]